MLPLGEANAMHKSGVDERDHIDLLQSAPMRSWVHSQLRLAQIAKGRGLGEPPKL